MIALRQLHLVVFPADAAGSLCSAFHGQNGQIGVWAATPHRTPSGSQSLIKWRSPCQSHLSAPARSPIQCATLSSTLRP